MPPVRFTSLASSPLCHWASEALFDLAEAAPPLGSVLEDAGVGAAPQADFFDLWWEVPAQSIGFDNRWVRISNGGSFSPYHRPDYLVADWENGGRRAIADLNNRYPYLKGNVGIRIQRTHLYGRPGITYGKRTDRFNAQILPANQIFTFEGIGVFPTNSDPNYILGILAYLNSRFTAYYLNLTAGLHKNDVYLRRLPFPFREERVYEMGTIVRSFFHYVQEALSVEEGHPLFNIAFLSLNPKVGLKELAISFKQRDRRNEAHYFNSISTIDDIISADCNLDDQTRFEIECDQGFDMKSISVNPQDGESVTTTERERAGFCRSGFEQASDLFRFCLKEGLLPDDAVEQLDALQAVEDGTVEWFANTILSAAVGSAFGRWDIRYATGERQPPELPDPFDPLPVCPPGMLQNADGLPAAPADVPDDYPLPITWPGILVSDPGHPEDIIARVRDSLAVIWGDKADAIEAEACEILKVKAKPKENLDALRVYFNDPNKFFKDHLKRYSKSRRKAPIYWPLSTESGSYTLWIYYHRLDNQTLFTCIEMVELKREEVGCDIESFRSRIGSDGSADEREKMDDLIKFQSELKTFHQRLLEVTKLPYRPNLNDGVQITAAPLWELFRNNGWQKVLKKTWVELQKEEYDWAHLAMSIWPNRVVPKCAKDRSLAIAHGIEDLLWVPDLTDKKKVKLRPLKNPDEELKLLKKADYSDEDLDQAKNDPTTAERLNIRPYLWIENSEGAWIRRLSPVDEIKNEITRRTGR